MKPNSLDDPWMYSTKDFCTIGHLVILILGKSNRYIGLLLRRPSSVMHDRDCLLSEPRKSQSVSLSNYILGLTTLSYI